MTDLRALLLASPLAGCGAFFTDATPVDASASEQSLYTLSAPLLDGGEQSLADFDGQVTLVVNVASKCGFTGQYEGLQALQETYGERGFAVLGFPSNDFGGQEPEPPTAIRAFCDETYGVTFPMFGKSVVKDGEGQSPVYAHLGGATGTLPGWNFGKYLVGRDGAVIEFYDSRVSPTGDELTAAIEAALES